MRRGLRRLAGGFLPGRTIRACFVGWGHLAAALRADPCEHAIPLPHATALQYGRSLRAADGCFNGSGEASALLATFLTAAAWARRLLRHGVARQLATIRAITVAKPVPISMSVVSPDNAAGPAYFAEGGLISPDPLKLVLPGQFVAAARARKLCSHSLSENKVDNREREVIVSYQTWLGCGKNFRRSPRSVWVLRSDHASKTSPKAESW